MNCISAAWCSFAGVRFSRTHPTRIACPRTSEGAIRRKAAHRRHGGHTHPQWRDNHPDSGQPRLNRPPDQEKQGLQIITTDQHRRRTAGRENSQFSCRRHRAWRMASISGHFAEEMFDQFSADNCSSAEPDAIWTSRQRGEPGRNMVNRP